MSISVSERMVQRLRMRHLELIVTIHEAKSILRASALLNMTQPAATKGLRDVEHTLETKLFERSNKGVEATECGEAAVRQARLILANLQRAGDEIEEISRGQQGRVFIGTLLAASTTLLPRAISTLKEDAPLVSVSVVDGTFDALLTQLTLGSLDMVVGRLTEFPKFQGLRQEHLFNEAIGVIVGADHPATSRRSIELVDLLEYCWILPPKGVELREEIEREFASRKLPMPENVIESISALTNRALVLNAAMIGLMPIELFRNEIRSGEVNVLPVELNWVPDRIGVITSENNILGPTASRMIKHLRMAKDCVDHLTPLG